LSNKLKMTIKTVYYIIYIYINVWSTNYEFDMVGYYIITYNYVALGQDRCT